MRKFPTLCIDDFYKNPDEVRKFALKQDFCESSKYWPGKRTRLLNELDKSFFDMFCEKLFSVYYDFESYVEWEVLTTFQMIYPLSMDKNSPKNIGLIHRDNEGYDDHKVPGMVYAGIVYLTPEIDKNCGTSIFKSTDSGFEETVRFYNYYNRLVSFDASTYHGVNSFYSDKEPRLTQPFFVVKIENNFGHPLERSDRRNLL